jgi:L-ribulose-5-phosphate 4-epimerase
MQNHGVFTIGSSAQEATKMAVEVEEIAKITHLAMLRGNPIKLEQEQIDYMVNLYRNDYGQR